MTDDNEPKANEPKAKAKAKDIVTNANGDVVRDFLTHDAAAAQAAALGKAHVEPIGVAFHVADDDE